MNSLRKMLRPLSLSLCLGLLAILIGGTALSTTPTTASSKGSIAVVPLVDDTPAGLGQRAWDGEIENEDSDGRNEVDIIASTSIILRSRIISNAVPIIQNQLAASVRTESELTILFGQLVI